MHVLVLGGTGFLGRRAVPALVAAGHSVDVARRDGPLPLVVDDDASLRAIVEADRYDVVVNLLGAGLARDTADPRDMTAVNAELPARLARALADLPRPPRLVHAASSTERTPGQGQDESEYSRTKHEGTEALRQVARERGIGTTIARIHNTYGPGQPPARFVMAMARSLAAGMPVTLDHPDRVRDFVYVDDVAEAIAAAVAEAGAQASDPAVRASEIGTGVGLTLRQAAEQVAVSLGRPIDLVRSAPSPGPDVNPVTVCPVRFGSYGTCTTEFREGMARTVRGM